MKILWITNTEIPLVSVALNKSCSVFGGWLDWLSRKLVQEGHEMTFLYPSSKKVQYKGNRFSAYSTTIQEFEKVTEELLTSKGFDVINCFGTEGQHIEGFLNAIVKEHIEGKVLVSIQGLAYAYSFHFAPMLPPFVLYGLNIHDMLLGSILQQKKKLAKQGNVEKKLLEKVSYVGGRTFWDKMAVEIINPNLHYHVCHEALRDVFYDGAMWNPSKMEKGSIFVSQSYYPLKGFHFLLEALVFVKKYYPRIKVYTTGYDLLGNSFKGKLKMSGYKRYLRNLIHKNQLEKNVCFLGQLSASEMHDKYLSSNVFVSCSSIENSSNSIGEAMILGCPVITSNVGGSPSLIHHEKDGLLYQYDAPYLLAGYILKVLLDDSYALQLGKEAHLAAEKFNDRDQVYKDYLAVYSEIMKKKEEK